MQRGDEMSDVTIGDFCKELAMTEWSQGAVFTSLGPTTFREEDIWEDLRLVGTNVHAHCEIQGEDWRLELELTAPAGWAPREEEGHCPDVDAFTSPVHPYDIRIGDLLNALEATDWVPRPARVDACGRSWRCNYDPDNGLERIQLGALFEGDEILLFIHYERIVSGSTMDSPIRG